MSAERPALDDSRHRPAFRRALLAWYRRSARDLPWRRTRDPYRIWLSEILLQQTRVETALPYYGRFVAALPTVEALAAAPLDRVLKLWEGLGYYTRARNLHRAAKEVVERYGGVFPKAVDEWRELPGVGRYTAAAIASIVSGEAVATVDGNIRRVLARLFRLTDSIESKAMQERCWTLADALLSRAAPGDFNQAMMELGANVCRPRQPECRVCPVRRWCAAAAAGWQERLPQRRKKRLVPHVDEVAGLIWRNGRLLLVQRPPTGLLGGLWELPGCQILNGEAPNERLAQHVRVKLGVAIAVGAPIRSVGHVFSHRTLRVSLHACRDAGGRLRPVDYPAAGWVGVDKLDRLALTTVTRKLLDGIRALPTAPRRAVRRAAPAKTTKV